MFLALDFLGFGSQEFREFEFDGTTTSNNVFGSETSSDDHNSVVEGSFSFLDELISSSSEQDSGGFGLRAVGEQVVSGSSDLSFLEMAASAENLRRKSINSGLNHSSGSLGDSHQIFLLHSTSAENSTVSEILGSQITNRQL